MGKLIGSRRWIARILNIILWLLFFIAAFGYALGGLIAGWMADKGNLKEAIVVYRLALKIYPWNVASHNDLGLTLLTYGEVEESIVHLRKAVQGAPHVAKYHNHLGIALLRAGGIDSAIHEFNEAIRLAPHYDEYKKNLEKAISAK